MKNAVQFSRRRITEETSIKNNSEYNRRDINKETNV